MSDHEHEVYFSRLLGAGGVTRKSDDLIEFGSDRTRVHNPDPSMVIFPRSTEDVRTILQYCKEKGLAYVPSGGRTGYAGAAVAQNREIVISFDRMNRILSIDEISATVEVEPGVILQNLQSEVERHGMIFPLDFGARGSCQIGGCISTNAGGHRVIKYGMTRELVVGLEVVTPDGNLLDLNANLHKNNSGYDLKQLFIGAEGTLGIITKATMKIAPKPRLVETALVAAKTLNDILEVLRLARVAGLDMLAFEFFAGACLKTVQEYRPQSLKPFRENFDFYALIEIDAGNQPALLSFLGSDKATAALLDAIVSDSPGRTSAIWALRDTISEAIYHRGRFHKSDVAVPISKMPDFVHDLLTELKDETFRGLDAFLFGHIGDGNVHVNLVDRDERSVDFGQRTASAEDMLCGLMKKYNGSISAEHGIGLLKKNLLKKFRNPEDLALMRTLKAALDPLGLCNPGKIID